MSPELFLTTPSMFPSLGPRGKDLEGGPEMDIHQIYNSGTFKSKLLFYDVDFTVSLDAREIEIPTTQRRVSTV